MHVCVYIVIIQVFFLSYLHKIYSTNCQDNNAYMYITYCLFSASTTFSVEVICRFKRPDIL